jgi:hypothetical protein
MGGGSTLGSASSTGFVLLPTMSNSPAGGAPGGSTSGAAIVFDAANRKIWVYDPVAGWKSTVSATIP